MVNLKDVAAYAGVSTSTVSRVLSNKNVVSPSTCDKVLEAVRALNYRPNILAKSLKIGRSNTIALLVPNIQNQVFADVVRGVEDTARKNGYTVVLCNTDEDVEIEKTYIEKMTTRWVDGFVVASVSDQYQHVLDLREKGFPVVLVDRYNDHSLDAVIIDNYHAAYNAVEYLIKVGHRKIAFAMGRSELLPYRQRFDGYKQALADHGIPFEESMVLYETIGDDNFYRLTKEMIGSGIRPDAIFAASDPKALLIMRALHDMKIKIPEEISVMGFDNIGFSSLMEPPLTTIALPFYEMGAIGARKLIHQIDYKEKNGLLTAPQVDVLPTDLILRKSVR